MTRLDVYLVNKETCNSRSIAQNLIKEGHVTVNGKSCTKNSYMVKPSDKIEVKTSFKDKTKGFWKLLSIEKIYPFLTKGMSILDLGSSKGGFLEYCALKCKNIVGIEISQDFFNEIKNLENKYDNIKLLNANIFDFNHELLKEMKFNCILNDLTLDPFVSFKALLTMLPYLKQSGLILFSVKLGNYVLDELRPQLEQQFLYNKLIILKELNIEEAKKEIHYILQKKDE